MFYLQKPRNWWYRTSSLWRPKKKMSNMILLISILRKPQVAFMIRKREITSCRKTKRILKLLRISKCKNSQGKQRRKVICKLFLRIFKLRFKWTRRNLVPSTNFKIHTNTQRKTRQTSIISKIGVSKVIFKRDRMHAIKLMSALSLWMRATIELVLSLLIHM